MTDKETKLHEVASYSEAFKAAQEYQAIKRVEFVDAIKEAHDAGATQMEIAESTSYSRQRIAQFLKEKNELALPIP